MKIVIKERDYEWESDYPEGWSFSSGDYFKYPVTIGNHPCFMKRFEKKDPASISGWDLLVKLEHKYESNLARVYDIASVEEKGKRIYYVVYEYLRGDTLDHLITHNIPLDLQKMTTDLFQAFASLRKYGFWFSDFTEKNFFLDESGRFVLMDLDSAQPLGKLPHDDMYGSKDYWALVFDFYKRILNVNDLKVDDLSGLSLNHLQMVFLIERLRLSFNPREQQYNHPETYNELPEELDKIDPAFRTLFNSVHEHRKNPQYAEQADEAQRLILQKIINYQPRPPISITPVIEEFVVSPTSVQKGESFEVRWKVKDAGAIELYKNGGLDERFTPQDTSVKRRAAYDGGAKVITYKLVAIRGDKQAESAPVQVQIVENKPVPPVIPPKPAGDTDKKLVDRSMRAIAIGGGVLAVVAIFLLVRWMGHKGGSEQTVIEGLNPRYIFNQNEPLTIQGKNFPVEANSVHVILNGVPALIKKQTADSVVVMYPPEGDQSIWRGSVSVGMIIRKDTLFAPQNVFVLKNLAGATADSATAGIDTSLSLPPQTSTGTDMTASEKRRQDSLSLVDFLKKQREKVNRQGGN